MSDQKITSADIKDACKSFDDIEPRDLFYRAATELVDLAVPEKTFLKVAEALGVLLKNWNKSYYKYRKFDKSHFVSIEKLLDK